MLLRVSEIITDFLIQEHPKVIKLPSFFLRRAELPSLFLRLQSLHYQVHNQNGRGINPNKKKRKEINPCIQQIDNLLKGCPSNSKPTI